MKNQKVKTVSEIDELIKKMNALISYYEKELGYKNIINSKVQRWLNKVNTPELSNSDKFILYSQINSYVRVLETFKEHSDRIKKETLKKILSGSDEDLTDESANYFFEIDTARRFILRDDFKSVDMKNDTDIIFESSIIPNRIFIECKNIRKEGSFENNIRKANNQLAKILDVDYKHKNLGIICLNLSEVIDKEKYLNLLEPIITEFIAGYERCGLEQNMIFEDRTFEMVMSSLLQGIVESKFRELFSKFENNDYKFNKLVVGVFYQAEVLVLFNNDENFFVARMATYYPFCSNKELCQFLFHPLACGI